MLYAFTTLKNASKFYWFSTFQALEWISPFDKMKKIVENRVNFAYPILAVNSAVIGQLCFKVCGNRIPLENFWTKSDIKNGAPRRVISSWFDLICLKNDLIHSWNLTRHLIVVDNFFTQISRSTPKANLLLTICPIDNLTIISFATCLELSLPIRIK